MLILLSPVKCRLRASQVLDLPGGFELRRGQHWCIFGGNGTGKTALVQLLLGRIPQVRSALVYAADFDPVGDICEVSFEEQQRLCALDNRYDISEFTDDARDIGTSVQTLVCGHSTQQPDAERLDSILQLLDIQHIRTQGIRYLSSGQMRRVMIARALCLKPALLVLDNPLESIDRYSEALIRSALRRWKSENNCTLFMCRRQQQMLDGMTHAAIVSDLKILEQGEYKSTLPKISEFAAGNKLRTQPIALPAACSGRNVAGMPSGYENAALISLRGVSAAYGDQQIFNDLHFEMHRGDHVLLEGPNGCGKSTLLGLIDGDNHKAYGQPVFLFGRRRGSGESVWDIKSHFGVVSNDLHNRYVKGWRVLDVVVSGFFDSLGLYDDSGASESACARDWLRVLGLSEIEREYYHELSFGQQRLVLLARAMVKQPLILVLDEPCVGLDDYHSQLLLDMVDFIAQQGQTQILFVSHSADHTPACINIKMMFELNDNRFKSGGDAERASAPRSTVKVFRTDRP